MTAIIQSVRRRRQARLLLIGLRLWWADRTARRALADLDDHLRHDIGLPPLHRDRDNPHWALLIAMIAWR